jgi:hypothetical protein
MSFLDTDSQLKAKIIDFQLQWTVRNIQEILGRISTGTFMKPKNLHLITKDNNKLQVLIHSKLSANFRL